MSYKVGTVQEVTYQAAKATSGLVDVLMEIYDETGAKDIPNFPDVTMTEIGATGRYKGSFTPDVEGKWRVMMNSVVNPGQVIKDFDVVGHDVDSVGDAVDGLNDVSVADVNTEVDIALADYDVAKASDVVSPPMVG